MNGFEGKRTKNTCFPSPPPQVKKTALDIMSKAVCAF